MIKIPIAILILVVLLSTVANNQLFSSIFSEDPVQFQNATVIHSSSTFSLETIVKFDNSLNSYSDENPNSNVQYLDLKRIHQNNSIDYSITDLKQVYGNTTLLYHVILKNEYSENFQPENIKFLISNKDSNYLLASGTIEAIEDLIQDDRIYKIVLPIL